MNATRYMNDIDPGLDGLFETFNMEGSDSFREAVKEIHAALDSEKSFWAFPDLNMKPIKDVLKAYINSLMEDTSLPDYDINVWPDPNNPQPFKDQQKLRKLVASRAAKTEDYTRKILSYLYKLTKNGTINNTEVLYPRQGKDTQNYRTDLPDQFQGGTTFGNVFKGIENTVGTLGYVVSLLPWIVIIAGGAAVAYYGTEAYNQYKKAHT